MYDAEMVAKLVVKVESILQRLYACYNVGADGEKTENCRADSPPKTVNKEVRKRRLLENYLQQQQMETTEKKNDLDVYLAEEPLNPMTEIFSILLWWKDNASRYKILSQIAKDVLAIPVSSVASESAFSTSGRILDPFRSSLSPKMVEALVCTQSWLKGSGGIKSNTYLDESHSYEFLELEEDAKGKVKDVSIDKGKIKKINVADD
ncbi:HAT, C-terminal dimerization domain containing protein [Heracleum sosnowskyi]|uniref:HAT, C-terminal dimerization domain containing protein n=1 Tax=Heracleum sosnowskyi TaxID=360622 RepID=A0AAD8HC72_9APIA|nr:HAT, C-terminal dimerization domain containing protein [Heracleum sosnowskyi]